MAQGIAQAFADVLADAAIEYLPMIGDAVLFAAQCTAAWKDLGVDFPYGEIRLFADRVDSGIPLELTVGGRRCVFHLVPAPDDQGTLPYRLLDLAVTGRLLELRLQAALQAGKQERHTLVGLTVHEWSRKLSDSINRAAMLKDAAIAAGLDEEMLDHAYGIAGTLQGDFGLPWILGTRSRPDRYFTTVAPCEGDVRFLQKLFEFHLRNIVGAGRIERPDSTVRFDFRCDAFPAANCTLMLSSTGGGVAVVGRQLDDMLIARSAPWPLTRDAASELTTREGMLSALTVAPRELLRNAIRHGDASEIAFAVVVVLRGDRSIIEVTVANSIAGSANVEARLDEIRRRCRELKSAIPFAECTARHDAEARRIVVHCELTIIGGTP